PVPVQPVQLHRGRVSNAYSRSGVCMDRRPWPSRSVGWRDAARATLRIGSEPPGLDFVDRAARRAGTGRVDLGLWHQAVARSAGAGLYVRPPTADDIAELADRALAAIPARLAEHVRDVGISVEEMPDEETLNDLGIETAWELTGLYRCIPLTERSLSDVTPQPDLIFLYRQPILLEWIETGEDL